MLGRAEVSPAQLAGSTRTACSYCRFADVCRFDPDPGRDRFRILPKLSANGYFERSAEKK